MNFVSLPSEKERRVYLSSSSVFEVNPFKIIAEL